MIEAQEAVRRAREAFLALHEDPTITEVQLAEVELSSDDRFWLVTLSYADDEVSAISKHKVLKIDAASGQVRSMHIRTL